MSPEIRFSTGEMTREAAHALVDAVYETVPLRTHDVDYQREARAMVDASASKGWLALLALLESNGSATIGQIAERSGASSHGVRTALGRALQSDYARFSWTWSGEGDSESVVIAPELQDALIAERSGENFGRDV